MAIPDSSLIRRLAIVSAGVVWPRGCGPTGFAARAAGAVARPATSVTIVEPGAFDWGDAGVGAVGALGLVLVAGGVAVVVRGRTSN
jgi:hypothetical protein